jgi:purine-binding chemotaxis protein CheW
MQATEKQTQSTKGRALAEGGKYLTFSLAGEEYGLEILKVREIIGIVDITSMPQMPGYVKGVMNLRGKVIPVIDLRLKFGLDPAEYTEQTCIVVVDVGSLVGVIVDNVQEVLDIDKAQIDPPPPLGAAVGTSFIVGMGRIKDDVKILLDIENVLSSDELAAVVEGAEGAAEEAV